MSNKTENERKSDGVAARLPRPVRSTRGNSDRKAEEFSEGAKRIARGGVSRKDGSKRTVASAVRTVRAPMQETPCVSVKGSTVCKETASSLAKKEARGGLETAKVTQTARIEKQANSPVQKTEVRTESSQRVQRVKVHLDKKEPSVGKQKSEPPAFSAKQEQRTPPCSTSKQPTLKINPNTPKSKESVEVSGKELLPNDQTSQDEQIQGKQLEYEESTSESSLDSDTDSDSDYENHRLEWDGFDECDIDVCCCLCEKNLGVPPTENGAKSEYSFNAKPVVAILPCGHAFHVDCFYLDEFELKPGGEPPCVICESTMSD